MKYLAVLAFYLLSMTYAFSQDNQTNQLKAYIETLNETSKQSCANLKQLKQKYESQQRKGAVESIEATMRNFCSCMPTQIKKARSKYKKKELKTKITQQQFLRQFQPVVDKCAAEQLRFSYDKKCPLRFKEAKENSKAYCSCMRRYLKKLSDSQISQIGRESSQHMKASEIAKEQGMAPPPKPRYYGAFIEQDAACSAF